MRRSGVSFEIICLLLVCNYAKLIAATVVPYSTPFRVDRFGSFGINKQPNFFFPTSAVNPQLMQYAAGQQFIGQSPVFTLGRLNNNSPLQVANWAQSSNSRFSSNIPSRTEIPIDMRPPTWQWRCDQFHNNNNDNFEEKQLQAYISGIEALTGTIQELDEAVQQIKPTARSCDGFQSAQPAPLMRQPAPAAVPAVSSTILLQSSVNEPSSTPLPGSLPSTTTESFTDPPIVENNRFRRDEASVFTFGLPAGVGSTSPVQAQDQAGEDLTKALSDLRALRKDLSTTAEWLKQTNHTVHSVMLKALQAYVISIERRVDHQRQLYTQTRGIGLKTKIAVIKEKVAILMDKLKSLVPFKPGQGNTIDREDRGPTAVVTITIPPPAPLVTSNMQSTAATPTVMPTLVITNPPLTTA